MSGLGVSRSVEQRESSCSRGLQNVSHCWVELAKRGAEPLKRALRNSARGEGPDRGKAADALPERYNRPPEFVQHDRPEISKALKTLVPPPRLERGTPRSTNRMRVSDCKAHFHFSRFVHALA